MKYLYTFLTLFFICTTGNSQPPQPKIQIGQPVQIDKEDNFFYAGHDDDNFYIIRTEAQRKNTLGNFEAFSRSDMKRISTKQLTVPVMDADEFSVMNIQYSSGKMYLFYNFVSKKDKKKHICVTAFDNTGKTDSKFTDLMQCDKNDWPKVIVDKEAKCILIWNDARDFRGQNTGYDVLLLKEDLSELYRVDDLKIDGKQELIKQYQLDHKGNLYLFYYDIVRTGVNSTAPKFRFALIDGNSKSISVYKSDVKSKANSDNGEFFRDVNGRVFFVAHRSDFTGLELYLFPVNGVQGKAVDLDYKTPFPGTKHKEGKPAELESTYIADLIYNADGTTRLILSSTYAGSTDWFSSWMGQIVLDKDFNWVKGVYIPKDQTNNGGLGKNGKNLHFEGNVVLIDDTYTYFIYNELPENFAKPDLKSVETVNYRNAFQGKVVPCYAVIDKDGKVYQKILMEKPVNYKSLTFRPDATYIIKENGKKMEAITVLELDDKLGFAKISLN
jgi:hypothetical protein